MFVLVPVNGCKSLQCSPVSLRGYFTMQQTALTSHPLSPCQTKPNRSFSLRALSVCLSPTFVCTLFRRHSSAAVSTCIARCCGRPFSVTYLPGTRLLAHGRRIVLGALAFHHNQTTLSKPFYPKSHPYTSGIWPRMTPFRSFMIADHFSRCSVSHDKVVRNAQLLRGQAPVVRLRVTDAPLIQT